MAATEEEEEGSSRGEGVVVMVVVGIRVVEEGNHSQDSLVVVVGGGVGEHLRGLPRVVVVVLPQGPPRNHRLPVVVGPLHIHLHRPLILFLACMEPHLPPGMVAAAVVVVVA